MKRLKAYLVMSLPYIIGCVGGWFVFLRIAPNADDIYKILLGLLLADLVCTVVVWAFGVLFKNSSFYDAYWSIIPWLIILGIMFRFSLWHPSAILFLIVFGIWSWRLTINWAYTCRDLKTEDWRYSKYRAENKVFLWHIINFFGINLMPTLLVFTALIPSILLVVSGSSFGIFSVLGAAIILLGTALETIADISMHKFLKTSSQNGESHLKVFAGGLRKYSRHPNYLGEILIWIGVYISALSVAAWWFAGMLGIVLLFVCVSIPLAERRHLARRSDYAEYKKNTRMLLPFPKFKK